jgi:hypothetical protein
MGVPPAPVAGDERGMGGGGRRGVSGRGRAQPRGQGARGPRGGRGGSVALGGRGTRSGDSVGIRGRRDGVSSVSVVEGGIEEVADLELVVVEPVDVLPTLFADEVVTGETSQVL